jgi:hypothetical protein
MIIYGIDPTLLGIIINGIVFILQGLASFFGAKSGSKLK